MAMPNPTVQKITTRSVFCLPLVRSCRNQDEVLDMEKKEVRVAGCWSLPDVAKATADSEHFRRKNNSVM